MEMLRRIKIEYGFSSLAWQKKDAVFNSDCGQKRIRFWRDRQLLHWHIRWRDRVSKQSGFLLDRMIRTKNQEPYFISERGIVTVHDEITEAYDYKGEEKTFAQLIATMLKNGKELSGKKYQPRFIQTKQLPLQRTEKAFDQLTVLDSMTTLIFERSIREAKRRRHLAYSLQKAASENSTPILLPMDSFTEAKQVFRHLFWKCGQEKPIKGYYPLRRFLEEWFEQNGEHSLRKLLTEIDLNFPLRGVEGKLLLAEFLQPYELTDTVAAVRAMNSSEEITSAVEHYFKSWDLSRRLVQIISHWLEEEPSKKVVAT